MHGNTLSAAASPQPLPSPTEVTRVRAWRAEARLRTVLRHVSALRGAQQQGGGAHVSRLHDPVDGTAGAALTVPRTSSSTHPHPNTAPAVVAAAAASSPPPWPLLLEYPLAPLAQRVEQKKARDATRQQRRDARQAAAVAAAPTMTTASATAADMVRNALSQPLGLVAARFLSAAASGAPLLFPDMPLTSTIAADGHKSNCLASLPSLPAPLPTALPSSSSSSWPPPAAPGVRTPPPSTIVSPSPPNRTPKTPNQSFPPGVRHPRSLYRHSHHRHQRLPSNRSASRYSWDSADGSPSPLALLLQTPPSGSRSQGLLHRHHASARHPVQEDRHCHHHHHYHHPQRRYGAHEAVGGAPAPPQSTATNAMSKEKQMRSSVGHQGSTPTTKTPHPAGVFGKSSINFLARTLREAGTAALGASPLANSEKRHITAADHHHHACHYHRSRRREKLEQGNNGASGSSLYAADGCVSHDSCSSCNSSCACSGSSYDSWRSNESSWSTSSLRTSFTDGVRSPPSEPFTPLTIPRDGRYDPHAPLLPLMRCYGDTPTREVFCRVPSTSTQHTESRSSTPMSSEWFVESSSTGTTVAGAAVDTAAHAHDGRGEPAERQRQRQQHLERHHLQHSAPFSSATSTQLSYMSEMDAIERGVVAPYMSYLFSPEARVIDLRQLESRMGLSDPAPRLEATCIGFSRAADVYLVGTSSGLLWRVPVGGDSETLLATPLGSLWPPHAPTSASSATTAPAPLPGHTAAILSIAFNDDSALFATTGMDGCVIVWNASTSAKLRRISTVWASSTSPSSTVASQHAPNLVRFMPQNNNYLLVSYLGSSELHLYNSSTGLPVTNVAGAGVARTAASAIKVHRKSDVRSRGSGGADAGSAASSEAITALAVDPVASPLFFSGDASGTIGLWTYRAGDVVTRTTLRATATASSTALAGSGAGKHARTSSSVVDPLLHGTRSRVGSNGDDMAAFSTSLYQLPELRRVTALALPEQMGGIAALVVSTLHISQLHSLFRRCGPRQGAASAQSTSNGGAVSARPALRHPLESTAQVFRAVAQQNRACWAAAGSVARNQHDTHGRSGSQLQSAVHSAAAAPTAVAPTSGDNSSFVHVRAGWSSRLSETFSALWRGSGVAPSSGAHSSVAPAAHEGKFAMAAAKGPASTAGAAEPVTAPSEGDLLRQLRDDALDAVCPLLVLVTLPCDTIYALGVLLQLQPGGRHSSAGGGGGGMVGAGTPTVSYRLYPLLKTTSLSRLRHLGVGAAQSPDNPRLIVIATPCEEGFVRVEPLLRLATPSPSEQRTPPTGGSATPTPGVGSLQPDITAAAAHDDGGRRSHSHVLAMLPMPYGGRCTGVTWSPNGRFLVAITAEGVIYQWARVYLLDLSSPSTNAVATAARTAFSEEDAWQESLYRELERQQRVQATLKLVAQAGAGDKNDAVRSSGYWLEDDDATNSAVTGDSLGGEGTESYR
ncbi:hypothetical protein LPMP_221090 [Leishmania panamensis]|uniref:Uncharacterized protein n=1 Tax=Leishmania panamensis TaxID=5679 RepID=A0A088RQJ9_LEIPA|nr:hypothetical protein LPMP_221090 [Leishmania panamensis]AIN98402.1 hypothetical protein LPMP_221090 [Leishmania panamensis]